MTACDGRNIARGAIRTGSDCAMGYAPCFHRLTFSCAHTACRYTGLRPGHRQQDAMKEHATISPMPFAWTSVHSCCVEAAESNAAALTKEMHDQSDLVVIGILCDHCHTSVLQHSR